jgi:hypothetical protein
VHRWHFRAQFFLGKDTDRGDGYGPQFRSICRASCQRRAPDTLARCAWHLREPLPWCDFMRSVVRRKRGRYDNPANPIGQSCACPIDARLPTPVSVKPVGLSTTVCWRSVPLIRVQRLCSFATNDSAKADQTNGLRDRSFVRRVCSLSTRSPSRARTLRLAENVARPSVQQSRQPRRPFSW